MFVKIPLVAGGGRNGRRREWQSEAIVVADGSAGGDGLGCCWRDCGATYLGGRAVRTQAWASGEEEGENSCSDSSGAQLEASRWSAFRSLELHPTM